jgi:hypothetical protein
MFIKIDKTPMYYQCTPKEWEFFFEDIKDRESYPRHPKKKEKKKERERSMTQLTFQPILPLH